MPGKVTLRIDADEARAYRAYQKLINQQVKLNRKSAEGGRKSKKAVDGLAASGARVVAQYASITAGITAIVSGVKKWYEYQRKVSAEARGAAGEMTAFALLQTKGKKRERVIEAAELGAAYGVSRGEAWTTVQAMQSVTGDYKKGKRAAELVFQAKQAGMEIETAREGMLLGIGASQQQVPYKAIGRPFVAGELSGRDPAALIKGTAGISFWKDKDIGWSAASVLAESVREDQLMRYLRRGGATLTEEKGKIGKLWRRLGVRGGTQMEKLRALRESGIQSAPEVQAAGIEETIAAQTVSALVMGLPEVERRAAIMRETVTPTLLGRKRAEAEAELPEMRLSRETGILEQTYRNEQALGAKAQAALRFERYERAAAIAMRRQGLGWLVGADGRAHAFGRLMATPIERMLSLVGAGGNSREWSEDVPAILKKAAEASRGGAEALERVAGGQATRAARTSQVED